MNENNKAGLNEIDMQARIADWIIANEGCEGMWCININEKGMFKGTECPLFASYRGCTTSKSIVSGMKAWLGKYHQQKAEAAEVEKQKAEAAKKEEQKTKQEPARICGNCKYIHEVDKSENMIAHCDMKKNMVPILFDRCPDFEPRAKAKRDDEDECHADAMTYNGILISTPSQEDKLRHKAWLLEIENSHRLNDVERLKAEAAMRTADDAERIAQLEKENSELQSTNTRLREELAWQFEQMMKKIEWVVKRNDRFNEKNRQACDRINDLETQNAQLQKKLDAAEAAENDARFCWIKEHERTRQRIKELEEQLRGAQPVAAAPQILPVI